MPARLCGSIVLLLIAPLAGGAATPNVTLGLVVPSSEPEAVSLLRGVQLAVGDANEAGKGPVALEVQGSGGQWGTAGNDAVHLISQLHADAVISPSDGATNHLILQVSGRTQVPVASLCSDSSITNAGVIWAVRVVPRTDQEVETLLASAQQPGRSPLNWWAIIPSGRPARPVRRDIERAAQHTGTHLGKVLEAGGREMDPAAKARQIVAAAPDGVLIWLAPQEAGKVAAALRAAGYGGRLAGPSPLDSPGFISAAGAAANGVCIAGFFADENARERARDFQRRFLGRFTEAPDFTAAAAHDAAVVLIEALRHGKGGSAGSPFPLALPITGVTGILHFDNQGNRTDPLQVMFCEKGCFIPLGHGGTKS